VNPDCPDFLSCGDLIVSNSSGFPKLDVLDFPNFLEVSNAPVGVETNFSKPKPGIVELETCWVLQSTTYQSKVLSVETIPRSRRRRLPSRRV
jgi:hypothetical protein